MMRSPRSSGSAIASPLRNTMTALANQVFQPSPVIGSAAGVNHATSSISLAPLPVVVPEKNRRRRKTGCSWRRAIARRVKLSIASAAGPRLQLIQEISLSWQ